MSIALFAGSFDPFTIGHYDIVERGLKLFDHVVVGVGYNDAKKGCFPLEQRLNMIRRAFAREPRVETAYYEGLTVDFARKCGASCLLRGVRNGLDLDYERQIAALNQRIAPEIETVLLMADSRYAEVSSSMVRELLRYGRDVSDLLPKNVDIDS